VICSASSRKRLADHDFLPINDEVRRIGAEINRMAAILELTFINQVPAKAESSEKFLLRGVLLGEIKDKPPRWHGFQLDSLAWLSEDFRRFHGHPPTKADGLDVPGRQRVVQNDHHLNGEVAVLSWLFSGVWPITMHSQGQREQ